MRIGPLADRRGTSIRRRQQCHLIAKTDASTGPAQAGPVLSGKPVWRYTKTHVKSASWRRDHLQYSGRRHADKGPAGGGMAISTTCFIWMPQSGFDPPVAALQPGVDLVLLFASGDLAGQWDAPLRVIAQCCPQAVIVGCSSAGEIINQNVHDACMVGVAVSFEHTQLHVARVALDERGTAVAAAELAMQIRRAGLRYVLLLSDGLAVNGSELAASFRKHLDDERVLVTGGLAADGARFEKTHVFDGAEAYRDAIVAVGFSGERLRIGHGSLGGWDAFGPTRTVTRSDGNILYELDGQVALELYKQYLGGYAKDLPASGLLFPLSIATDCGEGELVRTLLAIDEATQSMTFAGTIPAGSKARLMRANFDRLVDGASGAAEQTLRMAPDPPELALLISCVGRKMVLRERVEEEAEAVRDVLGDVPQLIGFYSYGELSPVANCGCELHNQTMTITTFSEA